VGNSMQVLKLLSPNSASLASRGYEIDGSAISCGFVGERCLLTSSLTFLYPPSSKANTNYPKVSDLSIPTSDKTLM
jgi:hypothetical protein